MIIEKCFTLGEGRYPEWFVNIDKAGRVTYDTNPITGALQSISVKNTDKTVTAFAGDSLFFVGKNVIVVPSDKAKQFNVQK